MGVINQVFIEHVVWIIPGWLHTGECICDDVVFAGHMLNVCCGFGDSGQLSGLAAGNSFGDLVESWRNRLMVPVNGECPPLQEVTELLDR